MLRESSLQEPALPFSQLPALLSACWTQIVGALDRRSAPRLLQLWGGALCARGRRPVTSWFQQLRNVYASSGALAVHLTLFSGVAVWAWSRAEEALVDRSRSPWDEEERRPSHADKRKALQREILGAEIRAVVGRRAEREEFRQLVTCLLDLAA